MPSTSPRLTLCTANTPGAIALLQLTGGGAADLLARLTGTPAAPPGAVRLADFAGIDDGLTVMLRDDLVQVMPHGGPRVVRRLIDRLIELGAVFDEDPDAAALYPEAQSPIEADVLKAIAQAPSPAAIDLLANQPRLWRRHLQRGAPHTYAGLHLTHLLHPPLVVVVGRPNVGKSTLTNAMLGRAVSIVADLPGTTRDWVASLAELGEPRRAIAVRWCDTPGLRDSDDVVEQEAIRLARQVLEAADVLIAMRDPATDWPELNALPRQPDVFVMNKIDDADRSTAASRCSPDAPLPISAEYDHNLDKLEQFVLEALGLHEIAADTLWPFSPTLQRYASGDAVDIAVYVGFDR